MPRICIGSGRGEHTEIFQAFRLLKVITVQQEAGDFFDALFRSLVLFYDIIRIRNNEIRRRGWKKERINVPSFVKQSKCVVLTVSHSASRLAGSVYTAAAFRKSDSASVNLS